MPYCAVIECKNDSRAKTLSKGGISYHRFPKSPVAKEKWIEATGRQNWFPSKTSTICSEHFLDSDFIINKNEIGKVECVYNSHLAVNLQISGIFQKNFLHGIQNARNILTNLEASIEKSNLYEDELLRCKASHKHSHDFDWTWDANFSDDKDFKMSATKSESNNSNQLQNPPINLQESWSTMSIVCLQYQYEELSKRYEALLKAFNDKCSVITAKKRTITRLRERARMMHAQLASAHKTLLSVGEKYLALKKRRHEQLQHYEKKIDFLKSRVREVISNAENARQLLDHKLSQCMYLEQDSEFAMLLAEMKKCNQLYMENLKLKAQLEDYLPGSLSGTSKR